MANGKILSVPSRMAKKGNGTLSILVSALVVAFLGYLVYAYFSNQSKVKSTPPTIIYDETEPVYVSSVYPAFPYYWGYGPRWYGGGWGGGGYYGGDGGWHHGGKMPGGGFGGGGAYHSGGSRGGGGFGGGGHGGH